MRRFFEKLIPIGLLILGYFGSGGEIAAQVPTHQPRIRETTKDILARPEFGWFPRLQNRPATREFSSRTSENGIPRFQSRRGGRDQLGEGRPDHAGGNPGNSGQKENGRRRTPNRAWPGAPAGDRPGGNGNPQDPQEAIGNDDVFPEAGNLDRLLDDQNFGENGGNEPRPDGLNNENEQRKEGDNPPPADAPKEPAAKENQNPPQGNPVPRGEAKPAAKENARRANRIGNHPEALPAPRPRESDPSESASPRGRPMRDVGTFARVVGAIFHIVAWMILAVICGLILALIIKAIWEFERPKALVPADVGSGRSLELDPAQAPGDLPADVYVTQARRLAENGHYREAVGQLLMGAMSRAERAGWVRFRRGMTVRDYLKGVNRHPAAYQGFRSIIRVFEPLTFGRREPTRAHFDKSLEGYEAGFGLD